MSDNDYVPIAKLVRWATLAARPKPRERPLPLFSTFILIVMFFVLLVGFLVLP